jgi:hypothetical protein
MIYQPPSSDAYTANTPRLEAAPAREIRFASNPSEAPHRTVIFDQRVFPLESGLCLRLLEAPTVEMRTGSISVRGWGLELPRHELLNLDRHIARQFLLLFGRAQRGVLSSDDAVVWSSIVEKVDYRQFTVERAAPRYREGVLMRHAPKCIVEWMDGGRETLAPSAAASLRSMLQPGDYFSAYGRFGARRQTASISRVTPLGPDYIAKEAALYELPPVAELAVVAEE